MLEGLVYMKIICDGDSWVFGCEIANPEIAKRYPKETHPGAYDYLEENDAYRTPKIFSTHLSKLFDAEVVNLSWPADDNGTIINRTITYLSSELSKGTPAEELFVIVGWSSPERTFFWYKDNNISRRFRLWPQVGHFDAPPQGKIWEHYVTYLWHVEEYIPRYVMNVIQLQNFCDAHNIRWMCFNSFYQTPGTNVDEWEDLNINQLVLDLETKLHPFHLFNTKTNSRKNQIFDYASLWKTVDPIRFYRKDQPLNTFKSFILGSELTTPFNGWHPSPEGHEIWAKELYKYITENKL